MSAPHDAHDDRDPDGVSDAEREELERLAEYYDTHDLADEIEGATRAPAPRSEPMVEISLRLPAGVFDAASDVAAARGVKVRALLREWIEASLLETQNGTDQATVSVSVIRAALTEYLSRRQAS